MTYCDTSFLLALYVRQDFFHRSAAKLAARFKEPIPFTLLVELELGNGIRRSLAAGIIGLKEHDDIFRQMAEDETQGILRRRPLHQADHFARSRDLSRKFARETSARSLDILHVAAALLLHATVLASFDGKQRVLARKAGLSLLPSAIPSAG